MLPNHFGEDAVTFFVAARIARDEPASVYPPDGRIYDPAPTFKDAFCRAAPPGQCDESLTGFVSPPLALPVGWLFGRAGDETGTVVVRLLMSASLAVGMAVMWNRIQARSRHAPAFLLATAILLTPLVFAPINLAQSTPLLFLLAALGLPDARRYGWLRALGLAVSVALKGFPIALIAIAIDRRRWRYLLATAGAISALAAGSLLVGSPSLWTDFARLAAPIEEFGLGLPNNGSVAAALTAVWPAIETSRPAHLTIVGVGLVAAAASYMWVRRTKDELVVWSAGWLLTLLITPVVWWHYAWLAVPPLLYGWARVPSNARLRLTMGAIVLIAAETLATASGRFNSVVQAGVLLVAIGVVLLLAGPDHAHHLATGTSPTGSHDRPT